MKQPHKISSKGTKSESWRSFNLRHPGLGIGRRDGRTLENAPVIGRVKKFSGQHLAPWGGEVENDEPKNSPERRRDRVEPLVRPVPADQRRAETARRIQARARNRRL